MTNFIVWFDEGFVPLIQQDFLQAYSHVEGVEAMPICNAYSYSVDMLLEELPVCVYRHYMSSVIF